MPTAIVLEVVEAFTQKGNYFLNKINFFNGYMAFEKFVSGQPTKFKVGENVTYTVTHPGHDGKPDWIEWVGLSSALLDHGIISNVEGFALKDTAIIAQNAMTNATNLHIAMANNEKIEPDLRLKALDPIEVLDTARMIALGIVDLVKEMYSLNTLTNENL